jgi:hypothetical protein
MVPPWIPSLPRWICSHWRSRAKPGFAPAASSRTSSGKASPETRLVDEVCERLLPVDLDDRQPLAIAGFELGVAGDVDLLELERNRLCNGGQRLARAFTKVAAGRVVENDARYGYKPRVVVASATRKTAQP